MRAVVEAALHLEIEQIRVAEEVGVAPVGRDGVAVLGTDPSFGAGRMLIRASVAGSYVPSHARTGWR
jgi:hypothetical protein